MTDEPMKPKQDEVVRFKEEPVQSADSPQAPTMVPVPEKRRPWKKILILFAVALFLFLAAPKIFHALRTVSTDDAFINSYVTFVAPRVSGQVARVLVEDNNRVKIGDT